MTMMPTETRRGRRRRALRERARPQSRRPRGVSFVVARRVSPPLLLVSRVRVALVGRRDVGERGEEGVVCVRSTPSPRRCSECGCIAVAEPEASMIGPMTCRSHTRWHGARCRSHRPRAAVRSGSPRIHRREARAGSSAGRRRREVRVQPQQVGLRRAREVQRRHAGEQDRGEVATPRGRTDSSSDSAYSPALRAPPARGSDSGRRTGSSFGSEAFQ